MSDTSSSSNVNDSTMATMSGDTYRPVAIASTNVTFGHLLSFVEDNRKALAGALTPRTICTYPAPPISVSELAKVPHTPRAANYAPVKGIPDVMMLPALPTGMTTSLCLTLLPEAFRMQFASVPANSEPMYYSRASSTWRALSMAIASVRMGSYWFLGSFPNVCCRVTKTCMSIGNNRLIQSFPAFPLTAEAHTYFTFRSGCERATKAEMDGMRAMYTHASKLFVICAAFTVGQISTSAFLMETRMARNRLRNVMPSWSYRALSLQDDLVWEVMLGHVALGFTGQFLWDVLALRYLNGCMEYHTATCMADQQAAQRQIAEALRVMEELKDVVPETAAAEPPPEAMLPNDDTKSEVDEVETPPARPSEPISEVFRSNSAVRVEDLVDRPNSVMGGGLLVEDGF